MQRALAAPVDWRPKRAAPTISENVSGVKSGAAPATTHGIHHAAPCIFELGGETSDVANCSTPRSRGEQSTVFRVSYRIVGEFNSDLDVFRHTGRDPSRRAHSVQQARRHP